MPPSDDDPHVPLQRFDTIDSTSLHARRLAEGKEPWDGAWRVIIADTQTAGRGQLGRPWSSPRGGLWFTLLGPIDERWGPAASDRLGLDIGRACEMVIVKVLRQHGIDRSVTLKLPNDVLVDGRKILGVLTEVVPSRPHRNILIGVGANANFHVSVLPREIADRATTLLEIIGSQVDLDDLRRHLIEALLAVAHAGPSMP